MLLRCSCPGSSMSGTWSSYIHCWGCARGTPRSRKRYEDSANTASRGGRTVTSQGQCRPRHLLSPPDKGGLCGSIQTCCLHTISRLCGMRCVGQAVCASAWVQAASSMAPAHLQAITKCVDNPMIVDTYCVLAVRAAALSMSCRRTCAHGCSPPLLRLFLLCISGLQGLGHICSCYGRAQSFTEAHACNESGSCGSTSCSSAGSQERSAAGNSSTA